METGAEDRVIELIEDYLDRSRNGLAPSVEEIKAAHPELADEIQQYFPLVVMFETAAESPAGAETVAELPVIVGKRFGRYLVENILGQGGMGTVYLAKDTQLDRQVALKIPKIDRKDGQGIERFLREAKAMATVHHPNLCPVFDAGEIDGQHFLTMAYIPGHTLGEYLAGGRPIPQPVALDIVRRLAEALQVAHDAGLVHRDLKPANIMVDEENVPVIMDFGLAVRQRSNDETLTKVGMLIGSPAYMSPEQIEGDNTRIGPRTDIYALGVILYEMLCGRRPFSGAIPSLLGQIASQDPPPLRELADGIDENVETLCFKAMAKNLNDRFTSATEFAIAIATLSQPAENTSSLAIDSSLLLLPDTASTTDELSASFFTKDTTALNADEAKVDTVPDVPIAKRSWWEISLAVVVVIGGIWGVVAFLIPDRMEERFAGTPLDSTHSVPRPDTSHLLPAFPSPTKKSTGEFYLSEHTVGTSTTRQIVLGDLDCDEDLDAILINESLADEVWLNDGQGLFEKQQNLSREGVSRRAALGDIDDDGDLDLVQANFYENMIWTNDGSGHFVKSEHSIEYPKRMSGAIALGDLDADGDLDAFIANVGNVHEVWLNDGSGKYRHTGQEFGGLSPSYDVALGDLDGDGDLDAWVANYGFPNEEHPWADTIWFNDGSGSFTKSDQQLPQLHSYDVEFVDADQDGDLDVRVASGMTYPGGSFWENNGNGHFGLQPIYGLKTGTQSDVAVGDLNGDGHYGLVLARRQSLATPFLVWKNLNGIAKPGEPQGWGDYAGVALGDLDGDGDLDAVLADMRKHSRNQIWLNQNIGEVKSQDLFHPVAMSENYSGLWAIQFGDLDGDRDLDALILFYGEAARILLNKGDGTFQESEQRLTSTDALVPALGDVDNDEDLDIYIPRRNKPDELWINNGKGKFRLSDQQLSASDSYECELADFDGDGDLDAFVLVPRGTDEIWWNDGNGHFTNSGQRLTGESSSLADVSDIDHDGDLDILVSGLDSNETRIWTNGGKGQFSLSGTVSSPKGCGIACVDLNGDHAPDLVVTALGSPLQVLFNDGEGKFTVSSQKFSPVGGVDVCVADFDGDGDNDIGTANAYSEPNQILLNDGTGQFVHHQWLGFSDTWCLRSADIDNDGDLDLFSANRATGKSRIWLNQSITTDKQTKPKPE